MDSNPRARAVRGIAALRFALIVAAAIFANPVWALDQRHSIAVGSCDGGGYMDYHWSVADAPSPAPDGLRQLPGPPAAGISKSTPIDLYNAGARMDRSEQYLPVRLVGTWRYDNDRPRPPAVRASANPIPEPGLWVVLIAGFLGMCAVARRRLFSS